MSKQMVTVMLDKDFVAQLRMMAGANNMSMAKFSRELAKGENELKTVLQRLRLI